MTLADLPSKHSRAGFNQTLNFIFTDEDAFASFLDASDHRTELHMALAKFNSASEVSGRQGNFF
jgi:hypothetical protein